MTDSHVLLKVIKRLIEIVAHPDFAFDTPKLALLLKSRRGGSCEPRQGAVIFGDDDIFSKGHPPKQLVKLALCLCYVDGWHSEPCGCETIRRDDVLNHHSSVLTPRS